MVSNKQLKNILSLLLKIFLFINLFLTLGWAYDDWFKNFEPYTVLCSNIIALIYLYHSNFNEEKEINDTTSGIDKSRILSTIQKIDKDIFEMNLSIFLFCFLAPILFYLGSTEKVK